MKEIAFLQKQSDILKEILRKPPKNGIVIVTLGSYGHIMDVQGNFTNKEIYKTMIPIMDAIQKTKELRDKTLGDYNFLDYKYREAMKKIDSLEKKSKKSWW